MGHPIPQGEGANFRENPSAHCKVMGQSTVSCAKTAEPIEIPFWLKTRVGRRNHMLHGGAYSQRKWTIFGGYPGQSKALAVFAAAVDAASLSRSLQKGSFIMPASANSIRKTSGRRLIVREGVVELYSVGEFWCLRLPCYIVYFIILFFLYLYSQYFVYPDLWCFFRLSCLAAIVLLRRIKLNIVTTAKLILGVGFHSHLNVNRTRPTSLPGRFASKSHCVGNEMHRWRYRCRGSFISLPCAGTYRQRGQLIIDDVSGVDLSSVLITAVHGSSENATLRKQCWARRTACDYELTTTQVDRHIAGVRHCVTAWVEWKRGLDIDAQRKNEVDNARLDNDGLSFFNPCLCTSTLTLTYGLGDDDFVLALRQPKLWTCFFILSGPSWDYKLSLKYRHIHFLTVLTNVA